MTRPRMTGRAWAYIGLLLGGAVSIAANVAHSYVPPPGAPAGWAPHAGAVISAIVWPVFLFAAIEILARVDWPAGAWPVVVRFGGLVPVATVAALVSYRHLSGLLAFYGEDSLISRLGPLAVDGLMVMATGALIFTSRVRVADVRDIGTPPVAAAPTMPADAIVAPRITRQRPTAAPRVAAAAKALPGAPVTAIAARAGVSESTARRHVGAVNGTPVLAPTDA